MLDPTALVMLNALTRGSWKETGTSTFHAVLSGSLPRLFIRVCLHHHSKLPSLFHCVFVSILEKQSKGTQKDPFIRQPGNASLDVMSTGSLDALPSRGKRSLPAFFFVKANVDSIHAEPWTIKRSKPPEIQKCPFCLAPENRFLAQLAPENRFLAQLAPDNGFLAHSGQVPNY